MVEGLMIVLVLAFCTLIIGIVKELMLVIIPQGIVVCVIIFLLVRVRVKIARAEKEKLKAKIEELEEKIEGMSAKAG